MKRSVFYKVVRVVEGDAGNILVSSCISDAAMVVYRPGRWAVPALECGPLCVFNGVRDAIAFVGNTRECEIWECEIIPTRGSEVWRNGRPVRRVVYSSNGTSLALMVKLTTRLYDSLTASQAFLAGIPDYLPERNPQNVSE